MKRHPVSDIFTEYGNRHQLGDASHNYNTPGISTGEGSYLLYLNDSHYSH